MELGKLKRDFSGVNAGVWVKDIPGAGDLELKVRGQDSDAFIDARSEKMLLVPESEKKANGAPSSKYARKMFLELIHEVLLLDWKNVTMDGEQVPFSKEAAKEFMENPELEKFHDFVTYATAQADKGLEIAKEAKAKKSAPPVSGT